MIRPLLTLTAGLCLTAGTTLQAQTALLHSDFSTARYDHSDTLRAVQHLFMHRSKATRSLLEVGGGLLATAAVKKVAIEASGVEKVDKQDYQILRQDANQDLVAGGLMAGYGLFRFSRFGPQQYRRVLEAYAQNQPLPGYLQRRLKTKYFRLLPL
ncbi:hypothetical protein [Hymenobacter perfusus]|uniref:Uncharacterized protein n=1 Tax=Hymenobacter perfusus TaxID=1236770 RepID=A0A3R9MID9_9BACT|nr:hypothetical protein [Hymenobacter perfusus]RSK41191.1 hypothetical protein EI293_17350 [Hymenobacter perfusus]